MGHDIKLDSSKLDHKSKKRHKHEDHEDSSSRKRKRKDKDRDKLHITDDDPDGEDIWVEKNIDMDGERVSNLYSFIYFVFTCYSLFNKPLAADIPTAESLKLTSSANAGPLDPSLPPTSSTETSLRRDDWMLMPSSVVTVPTNSNTSRIRVPLGDESFTEDYNDGPQGARNLGGGVDFFSSLGTEVKRSKPLLDRLEARQVLQCSIFFNIIPTHFHSPFQPNISSKELNRDLRQSDTNSMDRSSPPPHKANTPGGPGSQWRMMRLRRVYETAEEENGPIEEIAISRFGSLEAFEEAKEERRILDEREGKRSERGRVPDRKDKGREREGTKGFMFTDVGGSGASSRSSSFKRPGAAADFSTPSTPSPQSGILPPQNRRVDSLRLPSQAASPLAQSYTPIPSVMTPVSSKTSRALSPSSLNRLQAKVLRAKLMGTPDAETLEREYDDAVRNSNGKGSLAVEDGVQKKVEVLPTLDARGRLYDVGHGKDDGETLPGNRKKKENVCYFVSTEYPFICLRS